MARVLLVALPLLAAIAAEELMVPSSRPAAAAADHTSTPTRTPQSVARDYIRSKQNAIERNVLVSYTNDGVAFPSTRYTFDGLMNGLDVIAVEGFGADFKFNLNEGVPNEWKKGLISLSAFLANAMVESIQYDSCDERNWQEFDGLYAISNACGQEGYSYEDDECSFEFKSSCPAVPSMEVTAVNGPIGDMLPPLFQCKPGTTNAGYWDSSTGEIIQTFYTNVAGRNDIEGCCWWGRGALQTKGRCSIGKLNYYLGKKGADFGRKTLYPNIDFCQFPGALCASADDKNLLWNAGLFEWAERIQRYNADDWNYDSELDKFIQEGMTNTTFITSVSRIVSRKCHRQGCSKFEVRMLDERIRNFFMIMNDIFELPMLLATPSPTPDPTRRPSSKPTSNPTIQLIQKTNPNETPSMTTTDIISTDKANNGLQVPSPPNQPTYSDGLIGLEDNASWRRDGLKVLFISSILLAFCCNSGR